MHYAAGYLIFLIDFENELTPTKMVYTYDLTL